MIVLASFSLIRRAHKKKSICMKTPRPILSTMGTKVLNTFDTQKNVFVFYFIYFMFSNENILCTSVALKYSEKTKVRGRYNIDCMTVYMYVYSITIRQFGRFRWSVC